MEIWKDIKGFEGLYKVSNYGRIKSLNYNRERIEKILKQKKTKHGYLSVVLFKNKKRHHFFVHRLVAEAFIPNTNNLPFINHKDENKQNNFVGTPENNFTDGNLEWCDTKYNINYGTRNERVGKKLSIQRRGVYNTKKSKPVLQYTLYGDFIREFPSQAEVQRQLGFSQATISSCCRGIIKSHGGYIWKFKKEVV